jgi:hypothetical protein
MGPAEAANSWLDYVVAMGTLLASLGALAAVGLTLYLNVWRESRRQPTLTLELTKEASRGFGYSASESHGPTVLAPLNVKNSPGKRSAHSVEVLLSAGYWLGAPGTQPVPDLPTRFHESINQDPLTWWISDPPEGVGRRTAEIPPGVTRKAVILHSGHPRSLFESLSPHKELPVDRRPYVMRNLGLFAVVPLTQSTAPWLNNQLAYEVRLTVVAEDVDAVSYRTRLRWDGLTFDELDSLPEFVHVFPVWDPLTRIDSEAWPGAAPSDNRGWVAVD